MIEYDFQLSDTSEVEKVVYLTNSNDNSYFLELRDKDNMSFKVFFMDNSGITSTNYLNKIDFSKSESLTISCEFVSKFDNPYKYQIKNYFFKNKNDTLIDGENCSQYILSSNDSKREKKNKLAKNFYFTKRNTDFHLPLLTFSTAYEEYKLEKNIPNGIIKLLYTINYNSPKKHSIYHLKSFSKSTRYVIIPKEYNYSKS
ncbi:hypothetical protein ACSVH2_13530 [Flavobacterium sp. RSB2_4_14]|uniref:hypothetical protein n=1 Tax=Flavobacterium sp. RSB2_4_14 TaxID=3447665 RepID=UPI003F2EE448